MTQEDPEHVDSSNAERSLPTRRVSALWLGLFLSLALLALLIMTALSRRLPEPRRARFESSMLVKIKSLQPAFVLLGNSMVGTRFDEATLRRARLTQNVVVAGINASKSAEWYLVLKNLVIPSAQHPRLILFFRDEELTMPRLHAVGTAHVNLERFSRVDDPVVENKLTPSLRTPIERLAWYRQRVMPFQRFQGHKDALSDTVADFFSATLWPDVRLRAQRKQLNAIFDLANLRPADESGERAHRAPRFADVVQASFLPDMCALAKQNAIPLTFVKVRTRAAASGIPETPSERRYVRDLARYLRETCGAEFFDMHDEAWESIDRFGNGDHIAGRFKRWYTRAFVEHMGQIFH